MAWPRLRVLTPAGALFVYAASPATTHDAQNAGAGIGPSSLGNSA